MLLPLRFWAIAIHFPRLFGGARLHRAGLRAAASHDFALADRLFEAAGLRYRETLSVPALARLRVHQGMIRAESRFGEDRDAGVDSVGDLERRLLALERIEDLDPPFHEVPAADLLSRWSTRFAAESVRRAA